jgi:hypothetical protein
MLQRTFALTDHELERLRRRCRGTMLAAHPSGFNRKPFLVRLLKDACPTAAAKVKHMTTEEVESLCATLAVRQAPGPRPDTLFTEARQRAARTAAPGLLST